MANNLFYDQGISMIIDDKIADDAANGIANNSINEIEIRRIFINNWKTVEDRPDEKKAAAAANALATNGFSNQNWGSQKLMNKGFDTIFSKNNVTPVRAIRVMILEVFCISLYSCLKTKEARRAFVKMIEDGGGSLDDVGAFAQKLRWSDIELKYFKSRPVYNSFMPDSIENITPIVLLMCFIGSHYFIAKDGGFLAAAAITASVYRLRCYLMGETNVMAERSAIEKKRIVSLLKRCKLSEQQTKDAMMSAPPGKKIENRNFKDEDLLGQFLAKDPNATNKLKLGDKIIESKSGSSSSGLSFSSRNLSSQVTPGYNPVFGSSSTSSPYGLNTGDISLEKSS